jgi:phosphoglycolate phosphatase-like HAD superfamily hydrolase
VNLALPIGPPIRHVVWDWNGTLLADTDLTVTSANAALGAIGLDVVVTKTDWRRHTTRPIRLTYNALAGRDLTDAEWLVVQDVWMGRYLEGFPQVPLAAEAPAALERVRRLGLTQSIVSLHVARELTDHVAARGVAGYFAAVDGAPDQAGAGGTPSKAAMLGAHLKHLGLEPAAVVMVGDMADDALAAQAVGARAVLVATGDTAPERLAATGSPVAPNLLAALDAWATA